MSDRIIDPTRQGITPEEMPQEAVPESAIAGPYTLERTLALMDTWHDEMNWGLHQMCRALRAELEKTRALLETRMTESEARELVDALNEREAELEDERAELANLRTEYKELSEAYLLLQESVHFRIGGSGGRIIGCSVRWRMARERQPLENGQYLVRLADGRYDVREFLKPDRWGGDVVWWAAMPSFPEYDILEDGSIHIFHPTSGREPRESAGCFKMEGGE